MQWLKQDPAGTETYPLNGSVVQRLQRFATYGSLKQQVLRIITDELAISNENGKAALKKVCSAPADSVTDYALERAEARMVLLVRVVVVCVLFTEGHGNGSA